MPITDFPTAVLTTSTFAAGAVAGYMLSRWRSSSGANEYFPVGNVSHLFIYPVKSFRGISVSEAELTQLGLKQGQYLRDRVFMVIEKKSGNFLTARQEPKMVLIQPEIKDHYLELSVPGKIPVSISIPDITTANKTQQCRVWGQESPSIDCGEEVAEWLSAYLNRPGLRLVYYPWEFFSRLPRNYIKWGKQFKKDDSTIFGDLTTCHIVTEESIEDLNRRLPHDTQVTFRNFRANVVVKGKRPYEEDNWEHVRIGDSVACRRTRPCLRCTLTTINAETGEHNKGSEPLSTLKLYRQLKHPLHRKREGDSPVFGQYLGLDKGGIIRVGDPIHASFTEANY